MTTSDLTPERLRELLHYDPETGIFTWKLVAKGRAVGSIAGTRHSSGYSQICIGPRASRKRYFSHRLAWFYVHGVWPEYDVDHINHVKTDNRIVNLRPLNRSQNQQNQIKAHANNKTGFLGVFQHKKTPHLYHSTIFAYGKHHHLGGYSTPEEAHAAYVEAKRRLHPTGTL